MALGKKDESFTWENFVTGAYTEQPECVISAGENLEKLAARLGSLQGRLANSQAWFSVLAFHKIPPSVVWRLFLPPSTP